MAFKPPGLSTSPASSSLPNPAQHPTHELQFILCNSSPSHTSSGPSSESVSSYDTNVGQPFQVCLIGPYSDPSAPQRLASLMKMAPAQTAATTGPHPSYINVAQVYLFQQQLNGMMVALGTNANREDTFRLQGVQWINDVRTALQLPVRTFCTASHYYHKFRMVHRDNEYQFQDAAAAALLTACKIEDTLKKSREILCAAHNLTKSPAEYLSPDDSTFEQPSRAVIGLERLMLESSGFDFRVRYPHKHIIKLGKEAGMEKDVLRLAYNIMLDLYRTLAPLKQTCSTMAFACIELATLLLGKQESAIRGERSPKYRKWGTTRTQIIETIMDLLDLYMYFHKFNIVGADFPRDQFAHLGIVFNKEMDASSFKRFTEHQEIRRINGLKSNVKTPKTPATPASPADTRMSGMDAASPATLSPRSSGSGKRTVGLRGTEGTVRFMLDSEQAKREKDITAEYFKTEYEEYEVEVEEPIKPKAVEEKPRPEERPRHGFGRGGGGFDRGGGGYDRGGGGFDRGGGGYYHNKRARKY